MQVTIWIKNVSYFSCIKIRFICPSNLYHNKTYHFIVDHNIFLYFLFSLGISVILNETSCCVPSRETQQNMSDQTSNMSNLVSSRIVEILSNSICHRYGINIWPDIWFEKFWNNISEILFMTRALHWIAKNDILTDSSKSIESWSYLNITCMAFMYTLLLYGIIGMA